MICLSCVVSWVGGGPPEFVGASLVLTTDSVSVTGLCDNSNIRMGRVGG